MAKPKRWTVNLSHEVYTALMARQTEMVSRLKKTVSMDAVIRSLLPAKKN